MHFPHLYSTGNGKTAMPRALAAKVLLLYNISISYINVYQTRSLPIVHQNVFCEYSKQFRGRFAPKYGFSTPFPFSHATASARRSWRGTPSALFRLVNTYSRVRREGGKEGRSARFNHRLRLSASLPPSPRLPPACPRGRGRGPQSILSRRLTTAVAALGLVDRSHC